MLITDFLKYMENEESSIPYFLHCILRITGPEGLLQTVQVGEALERIQYYPISVFLHMTSVGWVQFKEPLHAAGSSEGKVAAVAWLQRKARMPVPERERRRTTENFTTLEETC